MFTAFDICTPCLGEVHCIHVYLHLIFVAQYTWTCRKVQFREDEFVVCIKGSQLINSRVGKLTFLFAQGKAKEELKSKKNKKQQNHKKNRKSTVTTPVQEVFNLAVRK